MLKAAQGKKHKTFMPVAVCDCTCEKKEVRSLPSQRFYISEHRENDLALTRSENEVNTT